MKLIFILFNLGILSAKQVSRNRTRSILTLLGVISGMFLFTTIETIQYSLQEATASTAKDTTLVVYRENRFCPATSRLPEHYQSEIAKVPGVRSVSPIQIVVNNCGTSLDVIVFRGIHRESLSSLLPNHELIDGSIDTWQKRDDGALIGKHLASRRNLRVGDRFDAAGVTVSVSGIIDAEENSQNNSVAFVHLPFLQQASKLGLGIVTQFNVKVENADLLGEVASLIDERFKSDTDPTSTQPEKAFFASTALELLELIRFSRWIGWACALAIVGLIANSILLTVRAKISEHAVLKTLGFSRLLLSWMIITEGLLLSLVGGIIGISLACLFLIQQSISIGNEGLILAFLPSTSVVVSGLWVSLILGLLAGVYPAWLAGRHSIAESLRAL